MAEYERSKIKRNKERSKENYKAILAEIKAQASRGNDSVAISAYYFNENITRKLREKGLTLSFPPNNNMMVTINWKDKDEET